MVRDVGGMAVKCFVCASNTTNTTYTLQVMKLLESIELRPSRHDMEKVLDELDWASIKADQDVYFAIFRASFR